MITLFVALAAGVGTGVLLAKAPREKRCGAWWREEAERVFIVSGPDWYRRKAMRCPERADPRCEAGYCTLHCRQKERCAAFCLEQHEMALKELTA